MMLNFIKRRRTLVVMVLIVAGLCLLMYIKLFRGDIDPPDVSDLAIEHDDIPDEENAVTYFNRAADIMATLKGTSPIFDDIVQTKHYDAVEMKKFMSLSKTMFEELDRGLECDKLRFLPDRSYYTLLPRPTWYRQLARMQSNRALHLFKQGMEEEAFEVLVGTMRFGAMMERGKGCMIDYLVALAIEFIGARRFRELLTDTTLEPERLRGFIDKLDDCIVENDALIDTFKVEFQMSLKMIDDIFNGREHYQNVLYGYSGSPKPGRRFITKYSLKPNTTKRMLADRCSTAIANIGRTPDKFKLEEIEYPEKSIGILRYRIPIGPNWLGKRLCNASLPGTDVCIIQRVRGNIEVGATQVLIALKCYKIENGDLPETLDELVPDYIDRLPEVDFDSRPLRYSKAKKIIYSIGDDMKDDGGTGRPTSRHPRPGGIMWWMDDHVLKIEF